jgi:hypothetical protein
MNSTYHPPANLADFDRAKNPQALYDAWDSFIGASVKPDKSVPAWYDPTMPPTAAAPQSASPLWQGLPHTGDFAARQ